jgi:hypothetical protein
MQGCLFQLAHHSYLTWHSKSADTLPNSPAPNKLTISHLVNCFHETGSVQDRNHSNCPSMLSDTVWTTPTKKSLRKLSIQSGFSYGSVHKAIKILKHHPYCVHVTHKLKEPDKKKQLQYCGWFTHFIWGGKDILDEVFYSNEAWLHLSGYVNSQKSRIWSAENLSTVYERPLHSFKARVWYTLSPKKG